MRRWRFFMLCSVASAFAAGSAAAQTAQPVSMTVDELVARAVADSPDLGAARAEIEAAVGRLQQAGLRPNPMLELGGQKALTPDNNLTVGLSVPLDLNGRKDGRVGVAERDVIVKRAQVADRDRRLRGDVRMKAGDYLAAQRNLEVTGELLKINRDALTLVQHRAREGATPALEANLMLVEVNRLGATRETVASRLEIIALQLAAMAGMAPERPLTLRGQLVPSLSPAPRMDAVRRALAARADVEAAHAEVAMARAMIAKEQAEGRWDATVNVGYQRQDFGYNLNGLTSTGQTRPIQAVFHYFGGGINVMLPVRNRNQGNIAAAKAALTASERRQQFAVLIVRQEVEAAYAQYEAAQRSLAIYERGVRDVARRNLDVVRQSHELGRVALLDVIAEQRRYIDVENGYTDALKQVYDASVEIQRAVGAER